MSILWFLILVIIIIVILLGFAFRRRYVGDYEIEKILWIYKGQPLVFVPFKIIQPQTDNDMVTRMLSIILNFSKNAMKDNEINKTQNEFQEIKVGEEKILMRLGRSTLLATVFKGTSGKRLYFRSSQAIKALEKQYESELISWSGNNEPFNGSTMMIKTIMDPKKYKVGKHSK